MMHDYMKDKVSELGQHVHHGADKARDWFTHTLDQNPLAAGAAFFTLGLLSGLAVPSTKPEKQLMGGARDRLMNQAQKAGSKIMDKGQKLAEQAVTAAKESVTAQG